VFIGVGIWGARKSLEFRWQKPWLALQVLLDMMYIIKEAIEKLK
jgi:hypothetical protein